MISEGNDFPVRKTGTNENPVGPESVGVFPVGISGLTKFLVWIILAVICWVGLILVVVASWALIEAAPTWAVVVIVAFIAGYIARRTMDRRRNGQHN